jgi:hypothetical protein
MFGMPGKSGKSVSETLISNPACPEQTVLCEKAPEF